MALLTKKDLTAEESRFSQAVLAGRSISSKIGLDVRSEVLAQILRGQGPLATSAVPKIALGFSGVRFVGDLNLQRADLDFDLEFLNCHFGGSVNFNSSSLKNLRFTECWIAGGMDGGALELSGQLSFTRCVVQRGMHLSGGRISGQLALVNVGLYAAGNIALALDNCTISGGVLFRRLRASGDISGISAHVDGDLVMVESTVRRKGGVGIVLDRASVAGGVLLEHSRIQGGQLRLVDSVLNRGFQIANSRISGSDVYSLVADRLRSSGLIIISRGSVLANAVVLSSATTASLTIQDSIIGNGNISFIGDGMKVESSANFGPTSTFNGQVRLVHAIVGDQVDLDGAVIHPNADGTALNADSATVGHAIFAAEVQTNGIVGFTGVKVPSIALNADGKTLFALDGAEFSSLDGPDNEPLGAVAALKVLERDPGSFSGSTFRHLSKTFTERVDERSARMVRVRVQTLIRRSDPAWKQPLNWVLKVTVSYGEELWRAGLLLLLAWAVGTYVLAALWGQTISPDIFSVPLRGFGFAPTDSGVPFNPLLVSLSAIIPSGGELFAPWRPSSEITAYVVFALRAVGWLLVTTVVSGLLSFMRYRGGN